MRSPFHIKLIERSLNMSKVFLGGTCNDTTWRDDLIERLEIDYFNPVVEDWTPECQEEERRQKEICDVHLYVITSAMTGVFSIAEAVQSSNDEDIKTVFCFIRDGFDEFQQRSLSAVADLIVSNENGGAVMDDLTEVAIYLHGLED
jgi:hypothetical protein